MHWDHPGLGRISKAVPFARNKTARMPIASISQQGMSCIETNKLHRFDNPLPRCCHTPFIPRWAGSCALRKNELRAVEIGARANQSISGGPYHGNENQMPCYYGSRDLRSCGSTGKLQGKGCQAE